MKTKITIGKIIIEIETDEEEEETEPVRLPVPQIIEKQEEKTPANGTHPHLLSSREQRILELVAEGMSNKEIALRLCVTESTVKVHMKALLRKVRCKNRTQAALFHHFNGAAA